MMGLYLDEVDVGHHVVLGDYLFTDENIASFSQRFVPVGFHLSADQAATGLFGGRVAAGWHTCCGWMTCFVASNAAARQELARQGKELPEIGPSPGIVNVRWPNPVRAGERITYSLSVTSKRPLKSRPAWGLVTFLSEGHNASGALVMSFESKVLVARRD